MNAYERLMSRARGTLELATTLIVLVAAGAYLWNTTLRRSARQPASVSQRAPIPIPTEPVALLGAARMGSEQATVAVIEFSDFQCPYCARFATDTLPGIKARYVDTGKILFVFRHNPLTQIHPRALATAQASECAAAQGRFWQLHDQLFEDPRRLEQADLREHAGDAGLDMTVFNACLSDQQPSETVKRDIELAKTLKLSGTPAFLIGPIVSTGRVKVSRVLTGARTEAEFAAVFDEILNTAGATH